MTKPPLIAHVIHQLNMGGLENGLVNLINRIPPDRYRHLIICAEDYSDFRDRIVQADVGVLAIRKSTKSRTALYRQLQRLFAEQRPTIVHGRNLSGLDALLPAWRTGVRVRIQGEHGWDVTDLDGSGLRPRLLRRLHNPLVNQYVTVSKHLAKYLNSSVGIAAGRITQIYNGVDTARFAPTRVKPTGILPQSFTGPEKLIIGTVGRLQSVKDQASLIRAFGTLLRETPPLRTVARLVIVGDGPQREVLAACAVTEGVTDETWIAGARNDLERVYQTLDVFVLPSLNEGISNTLLEAMASGLPVVVTAVGGNVELVSSGIHGQLVPPANPPALAAAIRGYLDDSAMRLSHGRASREHVVASFSLDTMVDRYVQLYDSMVRMRT